MSLQLKRPHRADEHRQAVGLRRRLHPRPGHPSRLRRARRRRDAPQRFDRPRARPPVRLQPARAGQRDRGGGLRPRQRRPRSRHGHERPGSTNAITGVLAAWLDSTPCLFISGQVKRADLKPGPGAAPARAPGSRHLRARPTDHQVRGHGQGSHGRYAPIWRRPCTSLEPAARARSGSTSRLTCRPPRSTRSVLAGAGDSWMALEPSFATVLSAAALADAASAVASALRASERPVLLAGNGIRVAGAAERFQALRQADWHSRPHDSPWDRPSPDSRSALLRSAGHACVARRRTSPSRTAISSLCWAPARCEHARPRPGGAREGCHEGHGEHRRSRAREAGVGDGPDVCADAAPSSRPWLRALGPDPVERPAWLNRCRAWRARYPFVTDASLRSPAKPAR